MNILKMKGCEIMAKILNINGKLTVYGLYEELEKIIKEGNGNALLNFDGTYSIAGAYVDGENEVCVY